MPQGTVARVIPSYGPIRPYANSLMRWPLPALMIAVLAGCLVDPGAARAEDAHLPPASQPPEVELVRQDMPTGPAANRPSVPPLLPPPKAGAVQNDSAPLKWKEPIGTRIDYNPYSQADSPSRRFNREVKETNGFVPGVCSAADYRRPTSGVESASPPEPTADEQLWLDSTFHTFNIIVDHGVFRSAYQQPLAPLQPLQPVQPPSLAPTEPTAPGGLGALGTVSIAELAAAVGGSPVQGVGQAQAAAIAPTDLGGLLQSASSVQSVSTTRRSPVALAPNIRGYEFSEIYSQANGAYWFPVREDMDSMLSKVDPGMIQDVVVIPGPYGLRYGPGLSYIDIVMQDTPRYSDGSGSDYRANGDVRTNGGQLYGRFTADGGNSDYGYRISYGHRVGDDYVAGNGLKIPSSYDNGDVWAQYGYNLSEYQKLEFSFLRLDQGLTNYPAQFWDVNTLETMGATLRAVDDDPASPWTKAVYEGWWNRTQFTGSITDSKRDPNFPQIQRVEYALDQEIGGLNTVQGDTLGDNSSSGARAVFLFGDLDDTYLRMGADFHFLQNGLRENFDITNTIPPLSLGTFSTNLPFASLQDEGLFAEYGFPMTDGWKVALGGRVDWINTNVRFSDVRPDTNLDLNALDQNDVLYAYYLTNEFKLNSDWKLNVGYGYAQCPPSLTERYADGMFLGLLQSGFTRVIGNDELKPERDFQIDVGLSCEYDNVRGSATVFYAWIVDYDTFEGDQVVNFFDARLVRYINTPLATLWGFETNGEWDWSSTCCPFAKMKYVQGEDQSIDGPLPSIPPLEGTVGLRWHDPARQRKWEFEVGERMVTAQNRLGEILILDVPQVVEERTPGFATTYIRTYYNWSKDMKLVAGIDNVFNRSYQEHLDLRLLGPAGFPAPATRVLSPGFTPYFGFDWTF
jgi:iron complex outermembrane recepter protein